MNNLFWHVTWLGWSWPAMTALMVIAISTGVTLSVWLAHRSNERRHKRELEHNDREQMLELQERADQRIEREHAQLDAKSMYRP